MFTKRIREYHLTVQPFLESCIEATRIFIMSDFMDKGATNMLSGIIKAKSRGVMTCALSTNKFDFEGIPQIYKIYSYLYPPLGPLHFKLITDLSK